MRMTTLVTAGALGLTALVAGTGAAAAGTEVHGPLHMMSSEPNVEGYRQKLWAMAPDLTGPRTYVYRNGAGEEVFTDTDNGTTNDEFDVFCPGAPGSDGPRAKILPERFYGPGALEVWQGGGMVHRLPVIMCGPSIGVPASFPAPLERQATTPVSVPGGTIQPIHRYPNLKVRKGCRRTGARTARCAIIVRNVGNGRAVRVRITDALPSGMAFAVRPKGARISGRHGRRAIWTRHIAPGKRARLMVTMIRTGGTNRRRVCNRAIVRLGSTATARGCVTFPRRVIRLSSVAVTG